MALTNNQKKDEAERTAKNIVEAEISDAKAAPEKPGFDAIKYKREMTERNIELDEETLEKREEEKEKNSQESKKKPGKV